MENFNLFEQPVPSGETKEEPILEVKISPRRKPRITPAGDALSHIYLTIYQ